MDELGGEILIRGDRPHNNYFAADLDIRKFCLGGVFSGGGKFDGPIFFEGNGGRSDFGDGSENRPALVFGWLGDDQDALGGQCAVAVGVAHDQNKLADFEVGRCAVGAAGEFDRCVRGDGGGAGGTSGGGKGDSGVGFGGNRAQVRSFLDFVFNGGQFFGDFLLDGVTDRCGCWGWGLSADSGII